MIPAACPKCGSNRIVDQASPGRMAYSCHDCGHQWPTAAQEKLQTMLEAEPDEMARELRREFRLVKP